MSIIITILQVALGMTIIVGLHELGHMLMAKLFGMRVEAFTLGFPPKILKKKIGETEYGIGAMPFGGYVTISGMVDESSALEESKEEKKPEPYEFRAKPAWQRILVILGGVIMNFLLGIFIYTFLTFSSGVSYLSKDEVNKYGITTTEVGRKLGFQDGDKILTLDGKDFEDFRDIFDAKKFIETGEATTLVVENQGEKREVILNKENFFDFLLTQNKDQIAQYLQCIVPRVPFEIKNVVNKKLPIVAGDKIVAIGGIETHFFNELQRELNKNRGKVVEMKFLHLGEEVVSQVEIDAAGKLGLEVDSLLKLNYKKFSFFESIVLGAKRAYDIVKMNLLGIWGLITGKLSAKENLSGPIGIVKVFTQSHDWSFFWNIIAVISLCLGLMNVLPIPALDGGHAFLILIECIIGHKIKEKYLIKIQQAGMALLLLLLLYCTYNDVIHLF